MANQFRPNVRLHRPAEYIAAFRGKCIARGALFAVYSPRRSTYQQPVSRLGMVIGKRNAPLAVSRNTIKRVIRESYRLRRSSLPNKDLVFRLVKPIPDTSLRQLKLLVRNEVNKLLEKVV